jgi:hypothetical protein
MSAQDLGPSPFNGAGMHPRVDYAGITPRDGQRTDRRLDCGEGDFVSRHVLTQLTANAYMEHEAAT